VEAVGDGFSVAAVAIVVEEDDRGIFCALVGGGNPIPAPAARGCKAKARPQLFLIGQLVEGFGVQWLETIDLPGFWPPALAARPFQLEASGLNGGSVLVQLQKSFRQELAQFAFDGVGLGIQQAAQI